MFQDRQDAGRQLAEALKEYKSENPLILALPRGGVPIGYEVAKALKAPLDIFIVRKVGLPWNPELAVGAVAPGVHILNQDLLQSMELTPTEIEDIIEQEEEEVQRRLQLYRQEEELVDIAGKTIILVDDGIATGMTTRAAIQAIKTMKPEKLILAVPVAPGDTVKVLEKLVDELICLDTPLNFYAVSAFYASFPQVSDAEVIALLKRAKEERS